MRVAICVAIKGKVYRTVWLNDSAGGFFVGSYGATHDVHLSYHKDGMKHFRDETQAKPFGRVQEIAIDDFQGHKQVGHLSCPLTIAWFTSKTEYQRTASPELSVVVGGQGLIGYDTLAVDTFLVHAKSEGTFLEQVVAKRAHGSSFELLASCSLPLEYFPAHCVVPVMWKANTQTTGAA